MNYIKNKNFKAIIAILAIVTIFFSAIPVVAAETVATNLTLELTFDLQSDKVITDQDHRGKVDYVATLTDVNGNPIKDAKIYISDDGNIASGYSRKTDANGQITFKAYFPEGEYKVSVQFKASTVQKVKYAASKDEQTIKLVDQEKPIIYDKDIRASYNKDGRVLNLNENIEYVIGVPRGDSQLYSVVGTVAENLETPLAYFRYKARIEDGVFYLASGYQGVYIPKAKAIVTPALEESPNVIWEDASPYPVTTALGWETASAVFYVKAAEGYEILPENVYANKTDNGQTKYADVLEYDPETGRIFLDGVYSNINLYVKATPID